MKQKYKDMLKKCEDLRETCEREGRAPTAEERTWANAYMDELEKLEENSSSFRQWDKKLDGGDHSCGKGYELRTARDKKDFRALYGASRSSDYNWTDKDSHFFQALFSGRFHPELTKRAMNEGVLVVLT